MRNYNDDIKEKERKHMLLIKNGHIKTMAGTELETGCLLIGDDGKLFIRLLNLCCWLVVKSCLTLQLYGL